MEEKRIGIFGGVFDPVHAGHKALAGTAAAALKLDSLYIIPCGTPPHKSGPVLPGEDRLLLLRAVFGGDPNMIVSDMEIRRKGVSYTWETVDAVRKLTGVRPFLLLGGDNLPEIKTWKKPERILELAQVVAVTRPGFDFLEKFPQYQGRIIPLTMVPSDVSSTQVRDRLKRGEDVSDLVPAAALKIIAERGFYR